MSTQLIPFSFESYSVRVILMGQDPWFVAKDVCDALDIGNTSMALSRLDDDEKGVSSIDTLGGAQEVAIINEPGLYSLVLGSRKPEAKIFKRWITHEVIPQIRKTGSYQMASAPIDLDAILDQHALIGTALREMKAQRQSLQQIDTRLTRIESAIPSPQTHTTIRAYAAIHNRRIDHREASKLGRRCSHITLQRGGVINAVPDDLYGTVNAYPIEIVERVFSDYLSPGQG